MGDSSRHATGFIIRHGVQTGLHIASTCDTVVTGMNKSGRVVGYYYSEAICSPYQGFVRQDGEFAKFSLAREGGSTYPKAFDANGNLVGWVTNADYSHTSFVARCTK